MTTEYAKKQAIRSARKALLACQADKRRFIAMYPEDHAELGRLYDAQIATLNARLDSLICGEPVVRYTPSQ